MGHGVVAELVTQCRQTEPQALYDMSDWAERYGLEGLYPELGTANQLNDDRVGRMLDAIYDQRTLIWGELIAEAVHAYQIDLSRLHADTDPIKFAGLFANQPEDVTVLRLELGYNPQGNSYDRTVNCPSSCSRSDCAILYVHVPGAVRTTGPHSAILFDL